MAAVASTDGRRYPRLAMRAHYDPEVDIALIVLERGTAVSEEHEWGLIDRNPDDDHLMGFEIWDASRHLPPELIAALPSPAASRDAA
jgi:uncharacterized protein YuzE